MKNIILYVLLVILSIIVILLSVNIAAFTSEYDKTKTTEIEDVIPNEEIAKKIADIMFNEHFDSVRIDGYKYDCEINFNNQDYEWEVRYLPIHPDGLFILGGNIDIHIRKDNGLITEMYCHQG